MFVKRGSNRTARRPALATLSDNLRPTFPNPSRGGLAASYVASPTNRPIVIWYGEEPKQ
jgi:hypothetical protein